MCKISTDIVLPISCVWYQNSRRLADTSLEEEGKHKENAIRSLYNYPYLEIEKTGQGMSPHQSLQDLSSSGIVRHLEDASGLLVLAARYNNYYTYYHAMIQYLCVCFAHNYYI